MKFSREITLILLVNFAGFCRVFGGGGESRRTILSRAAAQQPPLQVITLQELDDVWQKTNGMPETRRINAQLVKLSQNLGAKVQFLYVMTGPEETQIQRTRQNFIKDALKKLGYTQEDLNVNAKDTEKRVLAWQLHNILNDGFDFAFTRVDDELTKADAGKSVEDRDFSVPESTHPILLRFPETKWSSDVLDEVLNRGNVITNEELDVPQTIRSERITAQVSKLAEKLSMGISFHYSGIGEVTQDAREAFEGAVLRKMGYSNADLNYNNEDTQKAGKAKVLIRIVSEAFDYAANRLIDDLITYEERNPVNVKAVQGEIRLVIPEGGNKLTKV